MAESFGATNGLPFASVILPFLPIFTDSAGSMLATGGKGFFAHPEAMITNEANRVEQSKRVFIENVSLGVANRLLKKQRISFTHDTNQKSLPSTSPSFGVMAASQVVCVTELFTARTLPSANRHMQEE